MRLSANILSKSENFYKSPSKFFLSLLLSFIVGVYFGHYYWFNLFWQGGLAIAFLGFCFLFAKSKKIVVLAYLGLFFILGAFYYQWREESHKRQLAEAKDLLGRGQFLAVVAREPDKYQNGQRLEIDLKLDDKTELTLGKALLFTDFYPKYYYGDLIKFSGKLSEVESFSDFDYKSYLVRQGIVGTSFNPKIEFIKSSQGNFWIRQIYKFKSRVEIVIDKILPRPESALLAGLLIGRRQDFSQELTKAMQATGTSHIAAISGYNITIVAKILSLVLIGFILKRQQAFYLITAGIIFFVILTGSQASVVRAGIMGFLVILATQVGRASRVTNALALSAFVMILLDPFILRFDVGFQLSFLATIGLIYASPVLERRLKFLPNKLEIRSSLANSLAAQILVLPILLSNFGQFSLISPLANLLILPIIPIIMLFGGLAVLAGLAIIKLGWILAFPVWYLLKYQIFIINVLSRLPGVSWQVRFAARATLVYYLILFVFYLLFRREKGALFAVNQNPGRTGILEKTKKQKF